MKPRRLRPYLASAALVVVGSILLVVLAPGAAPDNGNPSSWATGRAGSWALYHLAQGVGASPRRLTGSGFGAALKSPRATLVEYLPTTPFGAAQVRAIGAFLRRGGQLLLAGGSAAEDLPLLALIGLAPAGTARLGTTRELVPLRGVPGLTVSVGSAMRLRPIGSGAVPLLGTESTPVAAAVPVGRGEAIVVGSGYPLSNQGLRRADDAQFAILSMLAGPGRHLVFDEIHHGYQLGDGVSALLWGTPLGAAAILVAALLLLYLGSQGRRLGRPLPSGSLTAIRSTDDHLEAMAQLYAGSGDRRQVVARYRDELTASLARRTRGGPVADAGALGPAAPLVAELARGARDGVSGPTLVSLAQRARRVELEMAGGNAPPEEVPNR